MLIYREMQKKDIASIVRIENIAFSQPWSKKGIADFLKQNNLMRAFIYVLSVRSKILYRDIIN